jgi:feruloyl esterase
MTLQYPPAVRIFGAFTVLLSVPSFAASDCEELLGQTASGQTKVTSAELIMASEVDPWTPPESKPGRSSGGVAVQFCRVEAVARPVTNSVIEFEVWMPTQWNGRFFGTSSGGLAGRIDYRAITGPVGRGYAAMGHNNGHWSGPTDWSWAIDSETGKLKTVQLEDFAWRSAHVSTVAAKELARVYYSKEPAHAYYQGCSQGGHHGHMETQRFPEDYDGVIVGGGGNDWTGLLTSEAWAAYAVVRNDHAGGIPVAFLPKVARHVMESCDELDGVVDGQIEEPQLCKPDFTALRCSTGQTADCLTDSQVEATKEIYAGPPGGAGGHMPGSEANWVTTWNAETRPGTKGAYADWWRLIIHQDPKWKLTNFNWPKDVNLSRELWDPVFGALEADLSEFKERGGKLIMHHGLADGLMPPGRSVAYWEQMESEMGPEVVNSFARLFLVPSGGHCRGGFLDESKTDWLTAMENWVEQGIAPDPGSENAVIGSGVLDDGSIRRRVLCPFPRVARYRGKGNIDSPENFTCSDRGSDQNGGQPGG